MSWTVGFVSLSAAEGSQKCARSFGSLAEHTIASGGDELWGEGEGNRNTYVQGGRFGEVG
jgi:hypothetical protein